MDQSKTGLKLRPSKSQIDYPLRWELLINFFLIATGALFLYVSAAYYATWYTGSTYLSKYLFMGYLLLLPSTHFVAALPRYFDKEAYKKILYGFGASLISVILFLLFQWLAWSDKQLQSPDSSSFIYGLVVAHAAYFLVAIGITISMMVGIGRNLTDMVKRLIYFTNGFQRLKLVLLARVWLFLNVLWGVVIFVFLFLS